MKDFPLIALLSATDIDSIRVAIIDIFGHLKKIRNTAYPVQRAQALVQAISRDLNDQLLKVLTSHKLLHVSLEVFDNIVAEYSDVFKTWEEEEDKFRSNLREIQKKRSEPSSRNYRRTTAEHKTLQDRLSQLGLSPTMQIF